MDCSLIPSLVALACKGTELSRMWLLRDLEVTYPGYFTPGDFIQGILTRVFHLGYFTLGDFLPRGFLP
jgi:hypothetical protein